jgi:hypothetical protein
VRFFCSLTLSTISISSLLFFWTISHKNFQRGGIQKCLPPTGKKQKELFLFFANMFQSSSLCFRSISLRSSTTTRRLLSHPSFSLSSFSSLPSSRSFSSTSGSPPSSSSYAPPSTSNRSYEYFSFGNNCFGQLGIESSERVVGVNQISSPLLHHSQPISIAAGWCHVLLSFTRPTSSSLRHDVVSWGKVSSSSTNTPSPPSPFPSSSPLPSSFTFPSSSYSSSSSSSFFLPLFFLFFLFTEHFFKLGCWSSNSSHSRFSCNLCTINRNSNHSSCSRKSPLPLLVK